LASGLREGPGARGDLKGRKKKGDNPKQGTEFPGEEGTEVGAGCRSGKRDGTGLHLVAKGSNRHEDS